MDNYPKCIYIFSGKRKSGKDYITDKFYSRSDKNKAIVVKLSSPIKKLHSEKNGLNFQALMGASEYKEDHRKSMLDWSQKIRNEDYGYFCKKALEMCKADSYPFWIISDARRKTDIKWFKENYSRAVIKLFLILSDVKVREQRGWVFTKGIDDEETECGLDDFNDWDKVIENNGSSGIADDIIDSMIEEMSSF